MPSERVTDTTSFIKRSQQLFTDQFDYRDCKYVSSKETVILYCRRHDKEEKVTVSPDQHKRAGKAGGCRRCKAENAHKRHADSREAIASKIKAASEGRHVLPSDTPTPKNWREKSVRLWCRVHKKYFHSNMSSARSGIGGCSKCKAENRETKGKKISANNQTPFKKFISRARVTHGEAYEYIESSYLGMSKNTKIICFKHGEFFQRASNHAEGAGCPRCMNDKLSESKFLRDSEKLSRAINTVSSCWRVMEIVDSGKAIARSTYLVRCHKHPEIQEVVSFTNLRKKSPCPLCSGVIAPNSKHKKIFYQREIDNLSLPFEAKVVLREGTLNVDIRCINHGFQQKPIHGFLKNPMCPICSQLQLRATRKRLNEEKQKLIRKEREKEKILRKKEYEREKNRINPELIYSTLAICKDMYNDNYEYPRIWQEATKKTAKITIRCKKHKKTFRKTISAHTIPRTKQGKGEGCKLCKIEYLSKLHRMPYGELVTICQNYGFNLVTPESEYAQRPRQGTVTVRCGNGHEIPKKVDKLKQGCSRCNKYVGEEITVAMLSEMFGFPLKRKRWHNPFYGKYKFLELDGYNEKYRVAVEYHGPQHYKETNYYKSTAEFELQLERDEATRQLCKNKGIRLIEIRYFEDFTSFDNVVSHLETSIKAQGHEDLLLHSPSSKTHRKVMYERNDLIQFRKLAIRLGFRLIGAIYHGKTAKHTLQCLKCNEKTQRSPHQLETYKSVRCKGCQQRKVT